MKLSFFRALNPLSANSGIYCTGHGIPFQESEVLDYTLGEQIYKAFTGDLNLLMGWYATFEILVGEHNLSISDWGYTRGAKGALDYLIVPLVARKLLHDCKIEGSEANNIVNYLTHYIAISLEIIRFISAAALTILLAPIVALVHLAKHIVNTLSSRQDIIPISTVKEVREILYPETEEVTELTI